MTIEEIRTELFAKQDLKYRDMQAKIIPTLPVEVFIGVRTPELRKFAKQLGKTEEIHLFLDELPHKYFDENQLHAFIISELKDYGRCIDEVNLDEDFDKAYPDMVTGIRSDEYYINMMTAWYFATALAKRYDEILPYIEGHRLDVWTHNKAIQKSVESYRITPEQKEYLKSLKIKQKTQNNS